jgi:hypothetical protein
MWQGSNFPLDDAAILETALCRFPEITQNQSILADRKRWLDGLSNGNLPAERSHHPFDAFIRSNQA